MDSLIILEDEERATINLLQDKLETASTVDGQHHPSRETILKQIEQLHESAMILSVCAQQGDYSDVDRLAPALTSWKIALSASHVSVPVGDVGLDPTLLIDYLMYSESEEVVDLVCTIIERMFAHQPLERLLEKYQNLFVMGLKSPSIRICQMTLGLLNTAFVSENALHVLLQDQTVMSALIQCIASSDIHTLERAKKWLIEASSHLSHHKRLETLFTPTLLSGLEGLVRSDDVKKFRVYDILTQIAAVNDDAFSSVKELSLMKELINQFNPSRDLLSTLNVIEVFIKMTESRSCAMYLDHVDVIKKLSDLITLECALTSVDSIVVAASVKFFGFLYFHQAQDVSLMDQKYHLLDRFNSMISAEIPWDLEHEIWVSLANVGSTTQGLVLLNNHSNIMNLAMEAYHRSYGDRKVVFLRLISCLFGNITEEEDVTRPILMGIWHSMRGRQNLPVPQDLATYCKSSIEELSITSFTILQHMTETEWGLLELATYLPVLTFLLERGGHFSRTMMDWKFSILNGLARKPFTGGVVGDIAWERIQEYVRRGPYYTELTPQVSMESA